MDRSHLRRVPGDPGQRGRRRADLVADDLPSGERAAGLAHSHVSQLAVSRLSPRASLALVRDIASADQVPVSLAEAIVEKAAGNAFFLEELTWSAVTERGHSGSKSVRHGRRHVASPGSTVFANGPGAVQIAAVIAAIRTRVR